ncbi:lipopolysaccharide biosynthesis protein [Flavobacterium sp. SOK18b]|uniref:lipopolysaccharide biosynthesis protein n=1 Tax=Flavobacterium sp. SOK18b TaxID=797900 RepID=UPI0015FCBDA1|nr:oligosaccharide flippase family protein [Flavobacterium sp. SOK18b]MBB1194696.1 lipopolysaccharide biosynthesis protein [Flavobacterium sp. SOK18b]
MVKKILSASIIYAIAPQLPKVIGILLLPMLTPYLSSKDFGIWGTIMAYTLMFSAARDFGMIAPMINSFYKSPTRWKWVWRQIIFFLMLFGIPYTIFQCFVIYLIFPIEAIENAFIIISMIAIQSLFFDLPNIIGPRYFQLFEKPLSLGIISMLSGFVALGIQLYVVIVLKLGYMGWFYAAFISAFFSGVIYWIVIYKNGLEPIFKLKMKWLLPRLKLSLPMLPHNYSAYLLNASDRMVMNIYKIPVVQIGQYNIAYMFGSYFDIFGNAIGMAVGPAYFKLFSKNTKDAELTIYRLTQFLQIGFILIPFLLSLWCKEMFLILVKNQDLQQVYPLAVIIIMSYSYRPLYWNVISRLQYNNLTNQLWKISIVGGVLNIVLNLIFIPIFGYKVAVITTFFSLMYIGFSGFFLKSYKELGSLNNHPLVWFLIILTFTFLAFVLKDINVFNKLFLTTSLIVCLTIYVLKNIKFLKIDESK